MSGENTYSEYCLKNDKKFLKPFLFVLIAHLLFGLEAGDIFRAQESITFSGNEFLRRSTNTSITTRIISENDTDNSFDGEFNPWEVTGQPSVISMPNIVENRSLKVEKMTTGSSMFKFEKILI